MKLRQGRHHPQHIYEVMGGDPKDDRLVGTFQTAEDAERICGAFERLAELEERFGVVAGAHRRETETRVALEYQFRHLRKRADAMAEHGEPHSHLICLNQAIINYRAEFPEESKL